MNADCLPRGAYGRFAPYLNLPPLPVGNMGDVIQPMAMEHLLASVAPDQCFWYAHPGVEGVDQGDRIGEFFSDNISGDSSRLIHLTPDHAEKVETTKQLELLISSRAVLRTCVLRSLVFYCAVNLMQDYD